MPETVYGEIARKIASGLETVGKELSEAHIPRLVRNVSIIALGSMVIYTVGVALGSMIPTAIPLFVRSGILLGYLIPLMFMLMSLSLGISIAKILVKA